MHIKDELKELDHIIKKIDSNLFIWVLMKFANKFENEFDDLLEKKIDNQNSIFNKTLEIIKNCETLTNIRGKVLLLIFDLNIDIRTKKYFLNELIHDQPDLDLLRYLRAIKNDKRLADFIFYDINKNGRIFKSRTLDIDCKNLLIASSDKNIFHKHELTNFYSNNMQILVNFYLTDRYLRGKRVESIFNKHFSKLESIKKISKTIIEKNIKNNEFAEWMYSYIEKNIIDNNELTSNINYTPHTLEEKKSFVLHQLDIWFLLDEDRYNEALKKIQRAWHKKNHDARKRIAKLDTIKK